MTDDKIKKWVKFAKALDNDSDIATDPYEICYQLGIDVVIRNLEKDGYLICADGCKLVFVSSRINNKHRQRFIAAHELGHFLLHDESMYCCSDLNDADIDKLNTFTQEYEANQFASELLLPEETLYERLPERKISFADISQIADLFNVSMTMCARKTVSMSKTGSELLLFYNDDRLQWFTAGNAIQEIPEWMQGYVGRYSKMNSQIGTIPKWRKSEVDSNVGIQYFSTYGNQKMVLISDTNLLNE